MYLEKLEVQGFKSFAHKNILVFPGFLDADKRGLTAVVGPNGSGKSNVADAIRWALGEQSMKTLRGKRAEDIIFSGTEKKGKLGMAEVSLFLNNSDGVRARGGKTVNVAENMELSGASGEEENKKNEKNEKNGSEMNEKNEKNEKTSKEESIREFNISPMDLSEIVLTRRLYRNGDSEYMLNNQRIRLSDMQMFLAKAKFGQKTYSVIGQGTVEGFLNTTISERKEFFDEATGVKQYQMKRDESLNKLRSGYENLTQASMLITEIEPRLKSLTRQVNRLNRRGELEKELEESQLKFYSRMWHDINDKFKKYNEEFLELESGKREKEKKLDLLNQQMETMEKENGASGEYHELQTKLNLVLEEKNKLSGQLARLEAQMEMNLESQGKFDLSFLMTKKDDIAREQEKIKEEISTLKGNLEIHLAKHKELEQARTDINIEAHRLNKELLRMGQAKEIKEDKKADELLASVLQKIKAIKTEEDITKLKALLDEIEMEIEKIIKKTEEANKPANTNSEWQAVHDNIQKISQKNEEIIGTLNDNNLRVSAHTERIKLLEEKLVALSDDLKKTKEKLEQNTGEIDLGDIEKKKQAIAKSLEEVNQRLSEAKEKLSLLNKKEEEKKTRLFSLQKELQAAQNEVNFLSNQLNDIRVNSTRYETKLEDLEAEIRDEGRELKRVKDELPDLELDLEQTKMKIGDAKRQLELIGGIDPQIEAEYAETKERYDFLTGQIDDFNSMVKSMEKIIKELDFVIKEQFDKEFKIIALNFEKYFKILFNGGTAKIIKVMEDVKQDDEEGEEKAVEEKKTADDMQLSDIKKIKYLQKHNATGLAGIEIQATPPGKKIQSIAMLSGGERALTAIALICAIINANPSPFVVLDEVDAALDEANSERLAKILDELSHRTQFIVITHNRSSMKRASILYGVTMGDDGVSKLLSVKLDEAAKTASR